MTDTATAYSSCGAPIGLVLAPRTIKEVVTLINALPKPLTISCYLQVLQRPLHVNATLSKQGIQKATGPDNPRIFIYSDKLITSILPYGDNSNLLELSQAVDDRFSIKGEIQFPVTKPLADSHPYQQTLRPDRYGTRCAACHGQESTGGTEETRNFYVSLALRPAEEFDLPIAALQKTTNRCVSTPDNGCEILHALFDHGEIAPWAFPASMPSFE